MAEPTQEIPEVEAAPEQEPVQFEEPEPEAEAGLDETPTGYEEAPGAFNEAPGAFDEAPGTFDEAPGAFDEAPAAYDEMPAAYDEMPEAEEQPAGGMDAMAGMDIPEERTALDDFLEQWHRTLDEKRAAESEAREEAVAKAKVALEEYMAQQEVARQARYESNRNSEQVKLEQLESEVEGNPWDRITGLIDVQAKDAKTKDALSDTSRMKSVLIQVKNNPLETTRIVDATA